MIPRSSAPVFIGNSLVFKRFRTKFTLVVRSKCFFRFFFQPIHLHGELANFFRNWKKEFLDKASVVFDDSREDNLKEKLALERKEKAEYAKKVGQLTMQVDWLKKKSEDTLGPDYESKFSPKPFED